jgi:probable F420-dependent oxidoreductase
MNLGSIGIWATSLRYGDPGVITDAAAELDELGYATLWLPGGAGGDVFGDSARVLQATREATVGVGVLNVWMHSPSEVAAGHADVVARYPGRFLLGLGVSHAPLVGQSGQTYERPLAKMRSVLDALDAAERPVPANERILAALGPKMLTLAGERSAGSHPYLVTPEHTAAAREVLGGGALLAPEQGVVLEADPDVARSIARKNLARYLQLPNYTNNMLRFGLTAEDLLDGGSDRLIDALVAWGDMERIAARIAEHHAAGADHVAVQVLTADLDAPREQWRRLAALL